MLTVPGNIDKYVVFGSRNVGNLGIHVIVYVKLNKLNSYYNKSTLIVIWIYHLDLWIFHILGLKFERFGIGLLTSTVFVTF